MRLLLVLTLLFSEGELVSGVQMEHYPHATLGQPPSNGVEVFFIEADGIFYLREDHMMGHADTFVGPFRGDPRGALAEAAGPVTP